MIQSIAKIMTRDQKLPERPAESNPSRRAFGCLVQWLVVQGSLPNMATDGSSEEGTHLPKNLPSQVRGFVGGARFLRVLQAQTIRGIF